MKITDPRAFHDRLDPVLREGPARVDRPLAAPPLASLLTVVGADGAVYWITYQIDKAAAWVLGVREPGGVAEPVTGLGCDQVGFRLVAWQPRRVFELLALSHRPMIIVRGTAADFTEVDTWPVEDRRG